MDSGVADNISSPTSTSATRYTHHANAFGLTGSFSHPAQQRVTPQAMVALPGIGGHGSGSAKRFSLRGVASFASARANVSGSQSSDSLFRTSASVVIEGLNIMDVITADQVVARLTSSNEIGAREPSIVSIGSHFRNLRIAGRSVMLNTAGDEELGGTTYTEARRAFKPRRNYFSAVRGFPKKAEVKNPPGLLTLVKDFPVSMGGGIQCNGHVIQIPEFGKIFLAEIEILPQLRRLVMMRIELKSTFAGTIVVASCECGGTHIVSEVSG